MNSMADALRKAGYVPENSTEMPKKEESRSKQETTSKEGHGRETVCGLYAFHLRKRQLLPQKTNNKS